MKFPHPLTCLCWLAFYQLNFCAHIPSFSYFDSIDKCFAFVLFSCLSNFNYSHFFSLSYFILMNPAVNFSITFPFLIDPFLVLFFQPLFFKFFKECLNFSFSLLFRSAFPDIFLLSFYTFFAIVNRDYFTRICFDLIHNHHHHYPNQLGYPGDDFHVFSCCSLPIADSVQNRWDFLWFTQFILQILHFSKPKLPSVYIFYFFAFFQIPQFPFQCESSSMLLTDSGSLKN